MLLLFFVSFSFTYILFDSMEIFQHLCVVRFREYEFVISSFIWINFVQPWDNVFDVLFISLLNIVGLGLLYDIVTFIPLLFVFAIFNIDLLSVNWAFLSL